MKYQEEKRKKERDLEGNEMVGMDCHEVFKNARIVGENLIFLQVGGLENVVDGWLTSTQGSGTKASRLAFSQSNPRSLLTRAHK